MEVGSRKASNEPLTQSGPPHGVDLFTFARISADMAEGDRPLAEVLRERGLAEEPWTEATLFWSARMADARVALAFSDAFAKAQDAKKALAPLSVEDWARLTFEVEEHPNGAAPALAARGLGMADHCRLVRHWARALASDPARSREYDILRAALGSAHEHV